MKLRLFVALELPLEVCAALPAVAEEQWRPLGEAALHVTLAFLGHRPQEDVPAIAAGLRGAVRPVGPVALGAALLLPRRAPRVLAVELVDESGSLGALQSAVSGALESAGVYTPERRAYLPHVTVARARRGGAVDRRAALPGVRPLSFLPEAMTLYRSHLHPSGARYEALERVELPSAART